MVGIGILFAAEPAPEPNIGDTVLAASIEGMEDGKTARLTTYDTASGERLDTTLVGFGPSEVRVAGGGVIVVTHEGGPFTVTAYALDAEGHLEQRGRTTLTRSNSRAVRQTVFR